MHSAMLYYTVQKGIQHITAQQRPKGKFFASIRWMEYYCVDTFGIYRGAFPDVYKGL